MSRHKQEQGAEQEQDTICLGVWPLVWLFIVTIAICVVVLAAPVPIS